MGDEIEIKSGPGSAIEYYKITSSSLKVDIKVSNPINAQAIIYLLLPRADSRPTSVEIHLSNTGCFINNPFDHEILGGQNQTIDAGLMRNEYTSYWITWNEKIVSVGRQYESKAFLSKIFDGYNIAYSSIYVGFRHTSQNQFVYWRFKLPPQRPRLHIKSLSGPEGRMEWKSWEGGDTLPEGALIGGHEDERIYIIRSEHQGSLTPGKFVPSKKLGFVSWGLRSNEKYKNLEFLCGYNGIWKETRNDIVPSGAIEGGFSEDRGERLYVGRAWHEGHLIPGKVQASHNCCYIAFLDKEIRKNRYEILVDPQATETFHHPLNI